MMKLLRRSKPSTDACAPAANSPAAAPFADDLSFLQSALGAGGTFHAASGIAQAPAARVGLFDDEPPAAFRDALPLPGSLSRARLAAAFGDEDAAIASFGAGLGWPSGEAKAPAASSLAAPTPSQAAPAVHGTASHVWTARACSLYRFDEGSAEMLEVDAGEDRGSLFGAVLKAPSGAKRSAALELFVYTAVRRRPRLRATVDTLSVQAPNEDSASFYDEHGIYWALRLKSADEALQLTRMLLAARATATGEVEVLETYSPENDDVFKDTGTVDILALRTSAALLDLSCAADSSLACTGECQLEQSVDGIFQLAAMDQQWGVGVRAAVAALVTANFRDAGACVILAVPPGRRTSGCKNPDAVLLVDLERRDLVDGTGGDAAEKELLAEVHAVATGKRREEFASPKQKASLTERMARLGVPTVGVPLSPSPDSGVAPASAAHSAELVSGGHHAVGWPAESAFPLEQPRVLSNAHNSSVSSMPANCASPMGIIAPALGSTAPASGVAVAMGPWAGGGTAWMPLGWSCDPRVHPIADIVRHYWDAVQATTGAEYAYRGALPTIPGLMSRLGEPMPGAAPMNAAAAALFGATGLSLGMNGTAPSGMAAPAVRLGPPSMPKPRQHQPTYQPPSHQRLDSSVTMSPDALVGALTLGELAQMLREVVRTEATPQGWREERQKLERRGVVLEEQLRSAREHEGQLREASRAQVAAAHSQLAETQRVMHEMRAQQLQLEGERQVRDRELESARCLAESELRQCQGELKQLNFEHQVFRDRLANAEVGRRQAEGAAADAIGSMPGLESRLRDQAEAVAALRQEAMRVASSRAEDAASVFKNLLGLVYAGVDSALPGEGGRVDAGALRALFRGVCRGCGWATEQQLQRLAVADESAVAAGQPLPSLGSGLDWEAVEAASLEGVAARSPLPDVGDGGQGVTEALRAQLDMLESEARDARREAKEARGEALTWKAAIEQARQVAVGAEHRLEVEREHWKELAATETNLRDDAKERLRREVVGLRATEEKWRREVEELKEAQQHREAELAGMALAFEEEGLRVQTQDAHTPMLLQGVSQDKIVTAEAVTDAVMVSSTEGPPLAARGGSAADGCVDVAMAVPAQAETVKGAEQDPNGETGFEQHAIFTVDDAEVVTPLFGDASIASKSAAPCADRASEEQTWRSSLHQDNPASWQMSHGVGHPREAIGEAPLLARRTKGAEAADPLSAEAQAPPEEDAVASGRLLNDFGVASIGRVSRLAEVVKATDGSGDARTTEALLVAHTQKPVAENGVAAAVSLKFCFSHATDAAGSKGHAETFEALPAQLDPLASRQQLFCDEDATSVGAVSLSGQGPVVADAVACPQQAKKAAAQQNSSAIGQNLFSENSVASVGVRIPFGAEAPAPETVEEAKSSLVPSENLSVCQDDAGITVSVSAQSSEGFASGRNSNHAFQPELSEPLDNEVREVSSRPHSPVPHDEGSPEAGAGPRYSVSPPDSFSLAKTSQLVETPHQKAGTSAPAQALFGEDEPAHHGARSLFAEDDQLAKPLDAQLPRQPTLMSTQGPMGNNDTHFACPDSLFDSSADAAESIGDLGPADAQPPPTGRALKSSLFDDETPLVPGAAHTQPTRGHGATAPIGKVASLFSDEEDEVGDMFSVASKRRQPLTKPSPGSSLFDD